jgi:hypothetical protein
MGARGRGGDGGQGERRGWGPGAGVGMVLVEHVEGISSWWRWGEMRGDGGR